MAKNDCRAALRVELQKIKEDFKKERLGKTDKRIVNGDGIDDALDTIADIMTRIDKNVALNTEEIATFKHGSMREIARLADSYKKTGEVLDFWDGLAKGFKITDKNIRKKLATVFQSLETAIDRAGDRWTGAMHTVIDEMATQGARNNPKVTKRAQTLLRNTLGGGDKLSKYVKEAYPNNDPWEVIHVALKKGSSKLPELDLIARTFKALDETHVSLLKKYVPDFRRLGNHVIPYRTISYRVHGDGQDNFMEFMRDAIDWGDNYGSLADNKLFKDAILKELFDQLSKNADPGKAASSINVNSLFMRRTLKFKTDELEAKFLSRYGDTDVNPFKSAMDYRHSAFRKGASFDLLGNDTGRIVQNLNQHIVNTTDIDPAKVESLTKMLGKQVIEKADPNPNSVDAVVSTISGLKSLASGGLTGYSVPRNMGWDLTWNPALQTGITHRKGVAFGFAKQLWATLTRAGIPGDFETTSRILQSTGIATKISNQKLNQGVKATLGLSDTTLQAKTFWQKAGKLVQKLGGAQADLVSKGSFADITYQSAKMYYTITQGNLLKDLIHKGINHATPEMKVHIRQSGFSDNEWGALKKLESAKADTGEDLGVLHPDSFTRLSEAEASALIRGGESTNDVRRRLRHQYDRLINSLIDEGIATTSKRGEVFHNVNPNTVQGALLNSITQFLNINLSQWYNLMRSANRASGFDPDSVGHSWFGFGDLAGNGGMNLIAGAMHNPKAYARMLTVIGTGAFTLKTLYDVIGGKTPSDPIEPEFWADGLRQVGFGGLPAAVWSNAKYNGDLVGTPTGAFIEGGRRIASAVTKEDPTKAKKEAIKLGSRIVPLMDTWYTRAAREAFVRKNLGLHPSTYEYQDMLDKGQDFIID